MARKISGYITLIYFSILIAKLFSPSDEILLVAIAVPSVVSGHRRNRHDKRDDQHLHGAAKNLKLSDMHRHRHTPFGAAAFELR